LAVRLGSLRIARVFCADFETTSGIHAEELIHMGSLSRVERNALRAVSEAPLTAESSRDS
jgi:hypothetical protein